MKTRVLNLSLGDNLLLRLFLALMPSMLPPKCPAAETDSRRIYETQWAKRETKFLLQTLGLTGSKESPWLEGQKSCVQSRSMEVCVHCALLPFYQSLQMSTKFTQSHDLTPSHLLSFATKKKSSFSSMEQWKHLSNIMWKVSKYRLFLSYIFFLFFFVVNSIVKIWKQIMLHCLHPVPDELVNVLACPPIKESPDSKACKLWPKFTPFYFNHKSIRIFFF